MGEEEAIQFSAQAGQWHAEAQSSTAKSAELQMSLQQSRRQWENTSEKLGSFETQCMTLRSEAHATGADLEACTEELHKLRAELLMREQDALQRRDSASEHMAMQLHAMKASQ